MRIVFLLAAVPALALAPWTPLSAWEGTRFLHEPDLSAERVVFVYGGDLWTVPIEGGRAKRLSSHPGTESNPKFSPDGAWIAYSAEHDGNVDVYRTPSDGGPSHRLTYHPGTDRVRGVSPDGTRVLFGSDRASPHGRPRLMTIPIAGGHAEAFPMHKAFLGDFSPDGRRLAYTPNRNAFITWKRYRGGETTPIWLVDLETYSHVEIPHENASDTFPVWMGDAVYFLSDRTGVMSLFRYDARTGEVERLVENDGTDMDHLSGAHGKLVFASGGFLHLYDISTGTVRQLSVDVQADRDETERYDRIVSEEIAAAAIAPDGSAVAFEAHGEILVAGATSGVIANVTRSPGSAERSPAWSPDGDRIAYFSDRDGEYSLYVSASASGGFVENLRIGEPGFFYQPTWSPDGKKIAYIDKTRRLWYAELVSGQHERIDCRILRGDGYAWSPDGRWLAYADARPTLFRVLTLHDVETGEMVPITDGMGDARDPAFRRDGERLYFLGSTNVGQAKTGLDLSAVAHENEVSWEIYEVSLSGPPPWDDIMRLPLPPGRYDDLRIGGDDELYFLEHPSAQTFAPETKLRRFDLDGEAVLDVRTGVEQYEVTAGGTKILVRSGDDWTILASGGDGRGLDVSSLSVEVVPEAEWKQIFLEAWRIQRDFFYDEDLHGVDWNAVRERYEAYLRDVRHRADLDFVLRQMVGELVNSHISVRAAVSVQVEPVPVGLLGADYEVAHGRYRFARLYDGTHWDDVEQRNPFAAAGVAIGEGDYLLEVDGRELRPPDNLYARFVGKAGSGVTLRIGLEPSLEGSRLVSVIPLADERELRKRAWVEDNLATVNRLSEGRIAYVHQPDTGIASLREFIRYFFPQSDRQAVIIDERFNDGGDDPDYQLDILDRQQVHWYVTRNEGVMTSPFSMIDGPKVMIINAEAASGGDVYPYQFKVRGLGRTVGTRTWGGVMGGGGGPRLIDGGFVRAPDLGTYAPDGEYILENTGMRPDVEVLVHPVHDHRGRDPQLERAVEMILEELARHPPRDVPRFERVDRSLKRRD